MTEELGIPVGDQQVDLDDASTPEVSTASIATDPLEELARRAESLATETEEDEVGDRVGLLLFRIGDEHYAVRVGEVREIFQEYEVTRIPCVPPFILGVINVRGEIISVTDPARLMASGETDISAFPPPPAIVVRDEDRVTALVVESIDDIIEVEQGAIEPPVSTIDRTRAEFVSGSVYLEGIMVGLLHTDRVLQPIVTARTQ